LEGADERSAGWLASKPAEFFCREDDDLVASVDRDSLRTLAADEAHQLAEAGLRVL
jgi:hypothetical protein